MGSLFHHNCQHRRHHYLACERSISIVRNYIITNSIIPTSTPLSTFSSSSQQYNDNDNDNRHHWSCLKNYVLSWQLKSDLAATSASLERVAPSQLQYFIFYQTMPSGCFHKKTCCFRSKPRTNYGKSPSWYCDQHVLKESCLTLAPNSCLCLCAKHSEENTSFDHEIPHG